MEYRDRDNNPLMDGIYVAADNSIRIIRMLEDGYTAESQDGISEIEDYQLFAK